MGSNTRFAAVTGASRGIGLELGRVLAKNAFDLLITPKTRNWSLGVKGPSRKRELRGCSPGKSSLGDHYGSDFDSTK